MTKKLTQAEELKKINDDKKALTARQKELRKVLNDSKEERKEARNTQAAARKELNVLKGSLRTLLGTVTKTLSSGDPDQIKDLATDLVDTTGTMKVQFENFSSVIPSDNEEL